MKSTSPQVHTYLPIEFGRSENIEEHGFEEIIQLRTFTTTYLQISAIVSVCDAKEQISCKSLGPMLVSSVCLCIVAPGIKQYGQVDTSSLWLR
jgi:hypothetical protein